MLELPQGRWICVRLIARGSSSQQPAESQDADQGFKKVLGAWGDGNQLQLGTEQIIEILSFVRQRMPALVTDDGSGFS
jgi:hypothetical protein